MRVQPARPRRPFTTTVTESLGSRSAAWSAAQSPAPPAPRIRMSLSTTSVTRRTVGSPELDDFVGAGGRLPEAAHRERRKPAVDLAEPQVDLEIRQREQAAARQVALDQERAELLDLQDPQGLRDPELQPVHVDDPLDAAPVRG